MPGGTVGTHGAPSLCLMAGALLASWVSEPSTHTDLGHVSLDAAGPEVLLQQASAPRRQAPCLFVHRLLATEQVPRASWSRLVGEVLLEGQSPGPGLEEKTRPKGTDRAAKSQPLRNPKRVELARRFPGAGGKKGCGEVRECGARQVRQFFEETGMNATSSETRLLQGSRGPHGAGQCPPTSKIKGQVWLEALDPLPWVISFLSCFPLTPHPPACSRSPEHRLSHPRADPSQSFSREGI